MDFKIELEKLIKKIDSKAPICFVRYGDGEVMLMNNQPITTGTQAHLIDKWSHKGGESKMGVKLNEILKINDPEWLFGIPCQCCNLICKNYLINNLNVGVNQLTYANMFVNSNYQYFVNWISTIEEDVVVIGNKNGLNNLKNFPFKVKEYFPIEDDCVNYYEDNSESLVNSLKEKFENVSNTLFFVSSGPLSEIIIHELWLINKTNRLIDVGSSLDLYIHNKITRPYMEAFSQYNTKVCVW